MIVVMSSQNEMTFPIIRTDRDRFRTQKKPEKNSGFFVKRFRLRD